MAITFDLSTPKQITFFHPMIERLRRRNIEVRLVTRDYAELDALLKLHGLRARSLGSLGGATPLGKLNRSAERVQLLARHFHRTAPDALVTLSNPESVRAAYGLRIPVICFNDLPESTFLASLTLPLASAVCAPWITPAKAFARYGVAKEKLFHCRTLDPSAWLDGHQVDPSYPGQLGLDGSRPLVVFRETEARSAYINRDILRAVQRELKRRHSGWQLLTIPRYRPHPAHDTGSLLQGAELFVGGGSTICIEAAYYGTPVIASRRCADVRRRRQRARRIFGRLRFPFGDVVQTIIDHARGGAST